MREREIAYRPAFLCDVKRLKRKHYNVDTLKTAIQAVAERRTDWLKRHRDHQLTGNLAAYRKLHSAADWLLLYTIDANETLILARTGSHDELLRRCHEGCRGPGRTSLAAEGQRGRALMSKGEAWEPGEG